MAGGHFEYIQYRIRDLAEKLQYEVDRNDDNGDGLWHPGYAHNTVAHIQHTQWLAKMLAVYLQRVDWLMSGDDSEESFHNRLREDLEQGQTK